jgi:hypothetical protein
VLVQYASPPRIIRIRWDGRWLCLDKAIDKNLVIVSANMAKTTGVHGSPTVKGDKRFSSKRSLEKFVEEMFRITLLIGLQSVTLIVALNECFFQESVWIKSRTFEARRRKDSSETGSRPIYRATLKRRNVPTEAGRHRGVGQAKVTKARLDDCVPRKIEAS